MLEGEEPMKKHNAEIVLRALLMGIPITNKDKQVFKYTETNNGMNLCVRMWSHSPDPGSKDYSAEEFWLSAGMSFNAFIKMCEEIPENEIVHIAGNIGLNEAKWAEKRKK
jgi:hypothetical protein